MDDATRQDGRADAARERSAEDEPAVEVAFVLPRVGDVVGEKYRIEKVVGRGGMGVVYAAHHLVLDQRVALKLLLVDPLRGDDTVERFLREAQASARLRSDHVVRVMDAGALDTGHPYLAMEYLEGCDLAELLSLEGPQPSKETADYMLQALAALAQAHAAGIVHRDLKPANLFLAVREDKANILKVLDFGISKQKGDRAHWKDLTGQAVLGTPVYMSPEQLRSSKSVDPRADLWSLGVVMYELLTGKVPFDGDGPGEVFAAVLERTPVSPRVHRPDLSPEWEEIVMRCLRRDPEARFQSAGQLAAAIAPLGSGRWAHLVGGIRKALTQPPTAVPQEAMVLVAAAVAAARASMPPSARATGGLAELGAIAAPPMLRYTGPLAGTAPLPGFSMGVPISAASPAATSLPESGTLSTSIAVADPSVTVAPIAARAAPPRSVRQPIAIAAAVVLSAGALLAAVHALRGPARAHAASVTPGATEGVRPPPSAPAPAASSASSASDEQPPSDAPPATPEPVLPQPSPSAATRAPDPAVSGHAPTRHPTRLPAKRPPADARPKFLKSWN